MDKGKLKRYEINQRLLQTDTYIVEAVSAADALKLYLENQGDFESIGSTGGWAWGEKEIVVVEKK